MDLLYSGLVDEIITDPELPVKVTNIGRRLLYPSCVRWRMLTH